MKMEQLLKLLLAVFVTETRCSTAPYEGSEAEHGGAHSLHRSAAVPTSASAASAPPSTSDQCVSIDQVCAPGLSSVGTIKQTLPHLHQEPSYEEDSAPLKPGAEFLYFLLKKRTTTCWTESVVKFSAHLPSSILYFIFLSSSSITLHIH